MVRSYQHGSCSCFYVIQEVDEIFYPLLSSICCHPFSGISMCFVESFIHYFFPDSTLPFFTTALTVELEDVRGSCGSEVNQLREQLAVAVAEQQKLREELECQLRLVQST